MAKEFLTLDVDNSSEADIIQMFQNFGWDLKSSQRVFNQDTRPVAAYTYKDVSFIQSKTETVDFTKLVFEREKNMPGYSELVVLENEFFELYGDLPDVTPGPILDPLGVKEWLKTKTLKPIILPVKNIAMVYGVVLAITAFIILKLSGSSRFGSYLTSVGLTTTLGFPVPGIPTAIAVYILSLLKLKKLEAESKLESDAALMKKYNAYVEYTEKINALKALHAQYISRMNEIVSEASIYLN